MRMTGLSMIYCLLGVLLVAMAASKPIVGRVIDGSTVTATDQNIPNVNVSYCIEINCLKYPTPVNFRPKYAQLSPEKINYFRKIPLRYCVENQNCMEYLKAELQTNAYLQQQKLKQRQLETTRMRNAFLAYLLSMLFLGIVVVFVIMKRRCMNKLRIRNRESHIAKVHDDIEMAESDLVTNKRKTIENAPESCTVLQVNSIDFCIELNGREHHTDKYDAMHRTPMEANLVVRRGLAFRLIVTFNRQLDPVQDSFSIKFTLKDDDSPSQDNETLIEMALNYDSNDARQWSCVDKKYENVLEIQVKPAADAPVGEWNFELSQSGGTFTYKSPRSFFLLFNPWCEDDCVYLKDAEECEEYVLSDSTLIWRGSYNRMSASPWQLGQFERNILECSFYLISTVGKIEPEFRGDPVRIARGLSAIVNSQDDNGVVMGKWGEEYPDGTAPTKWIGAVEILQQYYDRLEPVKYGQCWVFAGTLAAVARAIGIPSRIVTTYSCAHDTQASLTIDNFVDENGNSLEELNSDSIWNFHVWNELWMNRPNLDKSYDGWQAVDSTPQETSDGIYRCGPTPVRAIKKGDINCPYDCKYLFAAVNADKLNWLYMGPKEFKLMCRDTTAVGKQISTKAVGRWKREDITSTYKYPENSQNEHDAMLEALKKALKKASKQTKTDNTIIRHYLNEKSNDIQFNFKLLDDDIIIGDTFVVMLQIDNRSVDATYHISGRLLAASKRYTGETRCQIKSTNFDINISPDSKQDIKMEVTFDDYYEKLHDQAALNILCIAKVHEIDYDYYAEEDFRLRKPHFDIKLRGCLKIGQEIDVSLQFRNPLPIPLRNAVFCVQGTGLERQLKFEISEVPVDDVAKTTFKYVPNCSGLATLSAKFVSKQLNDVNGFIFFEVKLEA